MRIGLYDPYLSTLGGGERYILSIASCFSQGHTVTLFWDDKSILKDAEKRFNLKFENVQIHKNIFTPQVSLLKRYSITSKYDCIFFMSDGSVPILGSKKSILIYQFPISDLNNTVIQKLKLTRISKILCYSEFVKEDLQKHLGKKVTVIYPPVDQLLSDEKKRQRILTVGRFTRGNNVKKHDVLIEAFKVLSKKNKSFEFHIAGSHLPEDKDIVVELKHLAKGYPIYFHPNISYDSLVKLYGSTKLYWHAAGFGEDITSQPEKAEQFGISTVEAMSAGCVPIVVDSGGQKEIVDEGINGYRFRTVDELVERSQLLIEDSSKWSELSKMAKEKSKQYSYESFCTHIKNLL